MAAMAPIEIVLSGPGKNAMSSSMMRWIREQLAAADRRPILLVGDGDAFSAGLDLKEVASLDQEEMARFLGLLSDVVAELYHYPGPSVACVNGHAIAGGCVLTLASDWRIATENPRARIGLNEVALGVRFPPRVLEVVRRRLPTRHVERVLLGGALHAPKNALELGLIDELAGDPLTLARERLAELAAHPADSYAALKARLRPSSEPSSTAQALFRSEDVPAWTTASVKEAIGKLLRR